MKRLLKGGRLVDPANGIDGVRDILIDGERIARVGSNLPTDGATVVEIPDGLVICPGFIDMHVHLREPGQEHKETVATGTASAVTGGFTAVACMPNTSPVNDNANVTTYILDKAREANLARVYPIGAVSRGSQGELLADIADMRNAGCVAITDDGHPVKTAILLRRALEYAGMFGMPVIEHCEDPSLKGDAVAHEGYYAASLGLRGMPGACEALGVERGVLLAELTGSSFHVAHMSARASLRAVRKAKETGLRVTCEVAPHHFTLTDEALAAPVAYDTNTKMNPPLREAADRDAMLDGISDGSVDAIATDHAPHHYDEKKVEYDRAPFGIVGLETAVPLSLDRLVHALGRRAGRHHHHCARSEGQNRGCEAAIAIEEHPLRRLGAPRRRGGDARRRQAALRQRRDKDFSMTATLMNRKDEIREKALKDLQQFQVLMLDGHFDFGNGYHGRLYLNPHQLFRYPSTIWRFAQDLIDVLPASVLDETEVVAGPATGGALLAHTVAGLLDSRRAITGTPTMFAPFMVDAYRGPGLSRFYRQQLVGKNVLIVDDVRNTGQTLARCATIVRSAGGTVIATAELYDRMEATTDAGAPNFALAEYKAPENYPVDTCPMCKAGMPITTF
jgi:dihydroorotase